MAPVCPSHLTVLSFWLLLIPFRNNNAELPHAFLCKGEGIQSQPMRQQVSKETSEDLRSNHIQLGDSYYADPETLF